MQEAEALAFIGAQRWTFARTMPQWPHEYIVRGKGNTSEEFSAFVRFIRGAAVPRGWGRKTYHHWYGPDGYHYWTMGWPVSETTVINRALSAGDTSYEAKAGERWSGPDGRRPELV